MSYTKMTDDLDIIQKLADEPNEDDGLTAAELKAKFDEAGNTLKTFVNSLIDELNNAQSGGTSVDVAGMDAGTAMTDATVLAGSDGTSNKKYTIAQIRAAIGALSARDGGTVEGLVTFEDVNGLRLASPGTDGGYVGLASAETNKLHLYNAIDGDPVQMKGVAAPTANTDAANKKYVDDTIKNKTGDLADLETTDKSNLVGAINEARDRVYDDAGVTPVTYTYTNLLTQKESSVTLFIEDGTLTQVGDNATDEVKKAWNALLLIADTANVPAHISLLLQQAKNWLTLHQAGLVSDTFKFRTATSEWHDRISYGSGKLMYGRSGGKTEWTVYYNPTTNALESYSTFSSPLTITEKPDGTASVPQFALAADPTADMQVATKQYVDDAVENAGGRDISLGLSGIMEPGEVPVVKTVDDNGVPTSWGTRYIVDGATGSNSDLVSLLGLKAMMPSFTQNAQKMDISGAKVGQTLKINAVNESGEPTAWSAVDAFALLGDYISTAVSSTSTDNELASAKAVYDAITAAIGNIDTLVGTGEVTT